MNFLPIVVSRQKDDPRSIQIWQGDVRNFVPEDREIIFVIAPPDVRPEDDTALLRSGCYVEKLSEGNVYIVTSQVQRPEELTIYRNSFRGSRNCAPSPTSDARYHLQFCVPNFGILWQRLEKPADKDFAQTSSHYHGHQSEKWCVLSGTGTLLSRRRDIPDAPWETTLMETGQCLEIPAGTEHQLRTTTNFSTVLVMTGHPDGFSLADHFYVAPPANDLILV